MGFMSAEMPSPSHELLVIQGNAVARRQSAAMGIDPRAMRSRVDNGRWRRLQRGVYTAFSGEPSRETVLWATLLRVGSDAVLSHHTAAERHGLIDEPSANLYEGHGVCVELDGTAAHPADEQWRDKRRDNANAVSGIVTLRFGLLDLGDRRCETADAVATLLRRRGWNGSPRACGGGCKVGGFS